MSIRWRREGDGFWGDYPEYHVGFAMTHLRDKSDGLMAELAIHRLEDDLEPNGYLAAPTLINLLGPQTVTNLARRMSPRFRDVPWDTLLETVIARTINAYRVGEPLIDLEDVEPSSARREYRLTKLLPQNEISMIYADGGEGKSLCALYIAFALRTGATLPSGVSARDSMTEVGYFDWEANQDEHHRRLNSFKLGAGIPIKTRGIYYQRCYRPLVEETTRLQQETARRKLGLVIIDSVGYAAHGDIMSPAVATEMGRALQRFDTTVLLVHHMSKEAAKQERGRVDPFGTVYWRNSVRNAWELRAHQAPDGLLQMALFHRKDNNGKLQGPIGWAFDWDEERNSTKILPFDVGNDEAMSGRAGSRYILRGALRRLGQGTVSELAEETDLKKETVRTTLKATAWFVPVRPGKRGGPEAIWGLREGA